MTNDAHRDPALLTAAVDATAALERASAARDDAIRAASSGGWSVRAIAAETSLSAARIGQIIQAKGAGA